MTAKNKVTAPADRALTQSCPRGDKAEIKKVSRICSERCTAITVPNMASHKNKMDANSSAQIMGL